MKLNVGDLVELLYDGTTFSGVITAVTPERVELAFTLNIFVEGPGKVTWPNGADLDVDVGANALTKLHLRLPLEDVAKVLSFPEPAPPPRPKHPTRRARAKDLLDEAAAAAPPPVAAPEPVPPAPEPAREPEIALEDLLAASEVEQTSPQELGPLDDVLVGGDTLTQGSLAPEASEPRKREGIWADHEVMADGTLLATGELFPAQFLSVSATGCLARVAIPVEPGGRIQLKFKLGKDAFDLTGSVVGREGPDVYEIAYDTLPPEVRVRMLRAVLGLAKPEMRTQESWTYQLRQKGGA